jgi:hypothetical protein
VTFISFIVSSRVPRASVLNEPGCSCRFANEGDTVFECLGRIQFGLDGEILMIKKVKSGYKVLSEKTGKNLGGPYKSREEAEKRLRQVEFFKRKKG